MRVSLTRKNSMNSKLDQLDYVSIFQIQAEITRRCFEPVQSLRKGRIITCVFFSGYVGTFTTKHKTPLAAVQLLHVKKILIPFDFAVGFSYGNSVPLMIWNDFMNNLRVIFSEKLSLERRENKN